ncbi:oligosaccharide flippase family protein [Paludibacter sp.]|uniref:oligosaccharide flippase family protein n=1 Tax=Paludibacter sp. TaxID=1898105 RepID=UPI001353ABBE|nr:oligosaccharide flippase family protein [Paludibacter sp.]MTK52801.1 oligosaccharide flippase family protein [Paludibacter sp.]
MTSKNEYKEILKSTGVFGGTQIVVILSGLIKSKIVAILIGPTGVGISAVYNNILLMLGSVIGLGIGSSAIREIAKEHQKIGKIRVAKITQNLVLYLAVIGVIVTLICSFPLSKLMFGSNNYIIGFCIISFAVFFSILSTGYDACLKGFRAIKNIALISLYSSIGNILISLIMFYFWGAKAIPVTIALNALSILALNFFYTKKTVNTSTVKISIRETIKEAKPMVVLGIMLVISSLIEYFVINITNIVIVKKGSLAQVGLYQGAMQITNMSINLVFAAIANDYYPRLASFCNDKVGFNNAFNTQAVITVLLMVPILNVMIVAAPVLIQLFLSKEFSSISSFLYWILSGSIFMSISWCLYYIPLAYGHTKRFLYMSIIYAISKLLIQIPFYLFWGLKGIAIGNALTTFIYACIAYVLYRKIYTISFHKDFFRIFAILIIFSLTILSLEILKQNYSWLILLEILCVGIVCLYCWIHLNKRTDIINSLISRIKK